MGAGTQYGKTKQGLAKYMEESSRHKFIDSLWFMEKILLEVYNYIFITPNIKSKYQNVNGDHSNF